MDVVRAWDKHEDPQDQHWPCSVRVLKHRNTLHVYLHRCIKAEQVVIKYKNQRNKKND